MGIAMKKEKKDQKKKYSKLGSLVWAMKKLAQLACGNLELAITWLLFDQFFVHFDLLKFKMQRNYFL